MLFLMGLPPTETAEEGRAQIRCLIETDIDLKARLDMLINQAIDELVEKKSESRHFVSSDGLHKYFIAKEGGVIKFGSLSPMQRHSSSMNANSKIGGVQVFKSLLLADGPLKLIHSHNLKPVKPMIVYRD